MAILFRLRSVPDNEANEVRDLLIENQILFRETGAGFLGIGTAAIWVDQAEQLTHAQSLLDDYQANRLRQAQLQLSEEKCNDEQDTLSRSFRQDPVKFVVYIAIALLIIYLSTQPFWGLSE